MGGDSNTTDKKRNMLGYHRISVACGQCHPRTLMDSFPCPEHHRRWRRTADKYISGISPDVVASDSYSFVVHCRRRKVLCLVAADNTQKRQNCIRLRNVRRLSLIKRHFSAEKKGASGLKLGTFCRLPRDELQARLVNDRTNSQGIWQLVEGTLATRVSVPFGPHRFPLWVRHSAFSNNSAFANFTSGVADFLSALFVNLSLSTNSYREEQSLNMQMDRMRSPRDDETISVLEADPFRLVLQADGMPCPAAILDMVNWW